jgi:hypothetical protein
MAKKKKETEKNKEPYRGMRLYFAAPNNKPDLEAVLKTGHKNILFSYHYFKKKIEWLKEIRAEFDLNFFIDSGAFSSSTQGVEINLDEYIKFIHEFKPQLFAGLDDMTDPQKTWDNQIIMEQAGLNPMPTFHLGGEPIKWLHQYIEKYDYIALGGMVMSENTDGWLRKVWAEIWQRKRELKVHGFGLTDMELTVRYPFYSVDSSSYSRGVRFARMTLWSEGKKNVYLEEFWKYCRTNNIEYTKGQAIIGELRNICLGGSCLAFIEMINHINEVHKTNNFDYLTAQMSMF